MQISHSDCLLELSTPPEVIEIQVTGHPNHLASGDNIVVNEETCLTKQNLLKVIAAGISFFFAGNNDGSLGALTPYILGTYHVGTEYAALIYGATFLGWVFAALTNSHLICYLGLGGILTLGASVQVIAHVLRFWSPPFACYVITFFLQAAGMAYNESHANSFVASINGAHRLLGFVHAMYALGCLISPFLATSIAARAGDRWPLFYLYLVSLGVFNMFTVAVMFRESFLPRKQPGNDELASGAASSSRNKKANREIIAALKLPSVYLLSMFYFFMLGAGITAGCWLVEYLIKARNGHLPDVGYVPAGLWGGIFLGRIVLAEPTHRLGERRMTMVYCVMILVLQLVFWLVPDLVSSAVTISMLGFFYGPLFATGMSIGSKLFEKDIQPTALGFVFVLAQAGGAFFPAITGIVDSQAGVQVMQPILVGLIIAMGISWAIVSHVKKRHD
ncbi:MFS general substrate transporter [Plenodomus tracheiphilus IPT5]|uniref:MFS general substrate transporter n=1 Tax=Plenodomus tracheiphilus IPT5 TaxID=1408161 RepID=A0A6A7B1X7_9PLEO|nr:MFS general substrate transporter [Plenodomus tracheiphilus IPT5]